MRVRGSALSADNSRILSKPVVVRDAGNGPVGYVRDEE